MPKKYVYEHVVTARDATTSGITYDGSYIEWACTARENYEAGPCGFWLYDRLIEDGIETIVVPPSLIPIESGNKAKRLRQSLIRSNKNHVAGTTNSRLG